MAFEPFVREDPKDAIFATPLKPICAMSEVKRKGFALALPPSIGSYYFTLERERESCLLYTSPSPRDFG